MLTANAQVRQQLNAMIINNTIRDNWSFVQNRISSVQWFSLKKDLKDASVTIIGLNT